MDTQLMDEFNQAADVSQTGRSEPPREQEPFDAKDPAAAAQAFLEAAAANLDSKWRRGCCDHLPAAGHLVMSGDLHDNTLHMRKLLKLADLDRGADRHVVLHEVIHGPHRVNGMDLSVRILAETAALKRRYPDQVHLMMGNHELAQLNAEGILKVGANVVEAFDEGLDFIYGDDGPRVRAAMREFLRSLLLAVRCENGVFCSHSLPGRRQFDRSFDASVLDRQFTDADLAKNGSAWSMVWGRNHDDEMADALCEAWWAKVFVVGHQPADMGYELEGERIIVINSDHQHGVALPIELDRTYNQHTIEEDLLPLAAVLL